MGDLPAATMAAVTKASLRRDLGVPLGSTGVPSRIGGYCALSPRAPGGCT